MSNFRKSKENKLSYLLVILFLFSGFVSFSQTDKKTEVKDKKIESVKVESISASVSSEIDFMNWFMSSRQTQNFADDNTATTSSNSRKKQMISSGSTPNKVLYRTFVKKIVNKDISIA